MESQSEKMLSLTHIKYSTIYKFLAFIILCLPDDVFTFFAIYSNKTPGFIAYRWLDYSFNIILMFILVVGLLMTITRSEKGLWGLIVLAVLREVIFLITEASSCFVAGSYEIYLTLLTGIVLAKIVQYIANDLEDLNRFFWAVIIFNVCTVYLAIIMHIGHANRYNAVNLDVGSTGTICALTIFYCLFNENIKYRIGTALVALFALFFSGSRVNLLLTLLLLIVGVIIRSIQKRSVKKRVFIGFTCLALLGLIFLVYMDTKNQGIVLNGNVNMMRMAATFSLDEMGSDNSVLGRSTSIAIGLDIIKKNPFGISGYFTNIQMETIKRGFPTFPHSLLLVYYIFLGPIIFLLLFNILKNLKVLFKYNFSQFMVLLYMFAFITISGGPIVNFKLIYIYTSILLISNMFVNEIEVNDLENDGVGRYYG